MKIKNQQNGQALITLLFFVAISTIVTSAAIVLLYESSISTTRLSEGTLSYSTAESGIEEALLRLLRDPTYTGSTISNEDGNAIIEVSSTGANTYSIISTSSVRNASRRIQVDIIYNEGVFDITSWREMY